jgi:transcriptional regulator with XRE-family HTH domain
MNTIKEKIEFIRRSGGYTQQALAQRLGVSQPTIHRILSGAQRSTNHETYERVLALLDEFKEQDQ